MQWINTHASLIAAVLSLWFLAATIINRSLWPKPQRPPASLLVVVVHWILVDAGALLAAPEYRGVLGRLFPQLQGVLAQVNLPLVPSLAAPAAPGQLQAPKDPPAPPPPPLQRVA